MSGIVLDLQGDALNADVDVLTLLRKAFLVAKKLKLSDFEKWVNSEINGYEDSNRCPQYREISGEVKGWNPYHGWISLIAEDIEWDKTLSYRLVADSIASLVSSINSDGRLTIAFPGAICAAISKMTGFETKYALFISRNSLEAIIETVRTKILDWAIVLEENGITGDGLSFSEKEKEVAASTAQIIYYTNNFYKDANNIQIQQGAENSHQKHGI